MAKRVKRVIELMQGDPSRNFNLGKMAQSVNLSAPYFCFLFKSITGVPPAKYLKVTQDAAGSHATHHDVSQCERDRETRWVN